jgi:hypothetical protein
MGTCATDGLCWHGEEELESGLRVHAWDLVVQTVFDSYPAVLGPRVAGVLTELGVVNCSVAREATAHSPGMAGGREDLEDQRHSCQCGTAVQRE